MWNILCLSGTFCTDRLTKSLFLSQAQSNSDQGFPKCTISDLFGCSFLAVDVNYRNAAGNRVNAYSEQALLVQDPINIWRLVEVQLHIVKSLAELMAAKPQDQPVGLGTPSLEA